MKATFSYILTVFFLMFISLSGIAGITITSSPADTTINCGESESFLNTGQPVAITDCSSGGITITYTDVKVQSGACIIDSVITRTWEVTDACANSVTFDQVITIIDTAGPALSCPTTQVLHSSDGIDEIIGDYIPLATITDPCTDYTDLTIVQSPASGTNLPMGSNTINIQATDLCGNVSDCDFILEIYDTSGLYMIHYPNDTIVACDHSLDTALLGTGFGISTCPVSTVSYAYVDDVASGE